ncbi:MAG: pyrroloquinoline quinone biosynthesis protein PqqB [Acidobacteria bacterium]|nr:MAG: pyrroloquinoline quinone biosynthesis protein PqqB [Acidobacteriota bacterium]
MRVKVLGSAAGGGFPQWNCQCPNCSGLRRGSLKARPRTQTQVIFSPDSKIWFLLCASPDLRQQVLSARELAPPEDSSPSPIAGVFLPSADVDSVMGLLHLREFQSFFVFATRGVQCALQKENRIFRVLERSNPPVKWQTLSSKGRLGCHLTEDSSGPADFICTTLPLGGCYPDYVSEETLSALPPDEATIGFVMEQGDKRLFFAPSLSGSSGAWRSIAETSDIVFIDGTFWSDDELMRTGRSRKSACEIGHLPLSGPGGLLEQFPANAKGRKILIHINNTNPILDEKSAEHRVVLDAGFEIAYDGMELEL